MESELLAILATVSISLLSLLGLPLFSFRHFSFVMVSFAVGALLGDAIIHILPESLQRLDLVTNSWLVISGILLFLLSKKLSAGVIVTIPTVFLMKPTLPIMSFRFQLSAIRFTILLMVWLSPRLF